MKSRWTLLNHTRNGRGICRCECGITKEVNLSNVNSGKSKSCGCLRAEQLSERRMTHGMTHSKEYRAWYHMKSRCFDTEDPNYARYGGRGITVCPAWVNSFEAFLRDMGLAPSTSDSVDRKDVNGNYEPDNCRWADKLTQANNTTNNVVIEFQGQSLTVAQWADRLGLKYATLYRRLVIAGEQPPTAFRKVA